ncbi:MAG TPA: thiamine biosynthesis protein ThiS [Methanoregulaceae archaeon]|nr:thiamine biosynthesis protein ThiS [Methanoregulaceae archaeon]
MQTCSMGYMISGSKTEEQSMQVILPDKTHVTLPGDPVAIAAILADLCILPASVIVLKNGKLVPEDVTASGDDQVRIIRIAHGG